MADNWVVSPILPSISNDIGVNSARAALIIAAYMLPFGLFQLVFGYLADRFGKRQVIPKYSATSRCVFPFANSSSTSLSCSLTCAYLLFSDIQIPPIVVLLSYDWGLSCNVRFSWFRPKYYRGCCKYFHFATAPFLMSNGATYIKILGSLLLRAVVICKLKFAYKLFKDTSLSRKLLT